MTVRLLWIDDDAAFAALVRRTLGRAGFDVVHAANGEAGLEALAAQEFDVVALDHFMPGRTGLQILADIVARDAPPPVLYVTGADEGRIAVAALKAGASDYVLKDTGETFFDLLAATIRQAIEAHRLRSERAAAQAEVLAQRDRAEMLLKEMNHRVGNSLALVSSLAHLQAAATASAECREALEDFQRRVHAVAQVHKRLYSSTDVSRVALDQYLAELVDELVSSLASDAAVTAVRFEGEPMAVAPDRAVWLGVILTELVTNACKYAYAGSGPSGEVRVLLKRVGDELEMCVEDDGVGLGGHRRQGTGLGSRIVRAMSKSLGARQTTLPTERGLAVAVRAPL